MLLKNHIEPLINRTVKPFDRSKAAILLIDMQESFMSGHKEGAIDTIIKNQIRILKDCAEYDIPVFKIEWYDKGNTLKELQTELNEVPRVFSIIKYRNSAFASSALVKALNLLNTKHLVLVGVNTQYCIKDTAESALRRDIEIVTGIDLVSGKWKHDYQEGIDWCRKYFSFFGNTDTVRELLKTS
ncbi:MAG: cysteine hydrolase [Candidatus Pacebacteria bacterium]|nr:cysteine hydrolase [Candidatus Paceibacterota bacterium]